MTLLNIEISYILTKIETQYKTINEKMAKRTNTNYFITAIKVEKVANHSYEADVQYRTPSNHRKFFRSSPICPVC